MTDSITNTPNAAETHPLRPFLPHGARMLMCGTFPPQRHRWSMNFYYPNFINDMWRIFGIVFFNDKDHFVDCTAKSFQLPELKTFLSEKGIALSDTGREVVRTAGNASDKSLDIRRQIDLPAILAEIPDCHAVVSTGEKAAGVIAAMTQSELPKMGECAVCHITDSLGNVRTFRHWRMPSSSRAYPLPIERKAEFYHNMMKQEQLL